LLKDGHKVTLATREYAIFKNKSLINIYGGKWTTCRALAKKVARKIN
jgi:glycerol-3-phosphate dehydrogenase